MVVVERKAGGAEGRHQKICCCERRERERASVLMYHMLGC
jgi:hypothetical protein